MSTDGTTLNSTQQSTQSSFLAVHVITAQCHAILNTQFNHPMLNQTGLMI